MPFRHGRGLNLAFLLLQVAACVSLFEGGESDLIIPEVSCCVDPNGACIFNNCCNFAFMLRHLWKAIRHGGSIQPGHSGCRGRSALECCSVTHNIAQRGLPWYNHGLLTFHTHSRQSGRANTYLKLVQASALNYWRWLFENKRKHFSRSFPRIDIPIQSGAGFLWPSGYALGHAIARLNMLDPPEHVRFLEVGAGAGFASLVALLRGWHVLSTDLLSESAVARRFSAMASFGNSSDMERFQTAELDVYDERSWPMEKFHVIAGSIMSSVLSEQQKFHSAFRRLVASKLAAGGVGLYTLRFEAKFDEEIRSVLLEFLTPPREDELKGVLYVKSGTDWQWLPLKVDQATPGLQYLAVFQRSTVWEPENI
eukprot:s2_g49.t1